MVAAVLFAETALTVDCLIAEHQVGSIGSTYARKHT